MIETHPRNWTSSQQHAPIASSTLQDVLVGESSAIREIRDLIRYAAHTDIAVLVTGPSGCGKEVVARALHDHSTRHAHPFVAINCGAIPRDLLESELFGHEKGSFTGAIAQRIGRFEQADHGSLFLDEIGDMPFDMQVKLLRVLEDKSFERIGGSRNIRTNSRIISATHNNLEEAMVTQNFREDLFYRLSVFPIDIPALKHRPEDIEPLIRHFMNIAPSDNHNVSFSASAMAALQEHSWPGNARELRNIVERAAILFPNMVISADQVQSLFQRARPKGWAGNVGAAPSSPLAETAQGADIMSLNAPRQNMAAQDPGSDDIEGEAMVAPLPSKGFNLREYLQREERKYLVSALSSADGIVTEAAQLLRLNRTTFVEKMKRHAISRADILPATAPVLPGGALSLDDGIAQPNSR